MSIAAVVGCGDNGIVLPDGALPVDGRDIDAAPTSTISDVPDQVIDEDGTTGSLGFSVAGPNGATDNLTVTATSNNTSVIPDAGIVLGGSAGNRTVTVTPAANQFGSATITLTVTSGGLTATSDFTVTVNSVNDAPTVTAIASATVSEGNATNALTFTVADIESAAATLTLTATSSNTTLVPNTGIVFGGTGANRTVTVTPAATGTGTATITVSVSDGTTTGTQTFTVTVIAPTLANDPPVNTVPAAQTTSEDVPLVFGAGNVLAVSDIDAGTANVQVTLATTIGTITLAATSGLTFTTGDGTADTNLVFTGPITAINAALTGLSIATALDTSGTGTLSITTNDLGNTGTGGPQSDADTVAITVTTANDLPTISTITDQTITEDTTTSALAFTVGDVETPAAALTVTATSSNQTLVPNGSLVIGGTGAARTVTATPAADQFGSTIVTLTVTDAGGATSSSMFTLNVTGVNDAPTIADVPDQSMNLGTTLAVDFAIADLETAGTALTVTATSDQPAVTGIPVLSGTGNTRTVSIMPLTTSGATPPTITLTVSDGTLSATDTFTVTINDINDAPDVTVPGPQTVNVITTGSAAQRTLTFGALNAVSVTDPDSGTLPIDVTVTVDVGGTVAATASGGATVGGTPTALTITGPQAGVRATLATLSYIANTGFVDTSTITVSADDNGNSGTGGVKSDSATFTVSVNANPTITGLANTTVAEDGTITVTFTVADADGTAATVTTTATSSRTTVLATPTVTGAGAGRSIVLTPIANRNDATGGGVTVVTVTATDAEGGTVSVPFNLSVIPVNDAPVLSVPATVTGSEDAAITLSGATAITFTDVDQAEATSASYKITLTASTAAITLGRLTGLTFTTGDGTADTTIVATGTFTDLTAALSGTTLRLGADASGTGTLSVVLDDQANGGAGALTDSESIAYTFVAQNDAPVQSNASGLATLTTNTARPNLHVDLSDIDAGATLVTTTIHSDQGSISLPTSTGLTFTTGSAAGGATLVFNGTVTDVDAALNAFTFTPNANFEGDARVEVTTNDNGATGAGGALSATSNIYTTFTAIANTAPTITAVADVTVAEDNSTAAIAFTIADGETSPGNLNVSVSGGGSGTIVATLGGTGANRTVTATPAANYVGAQTFTISVNDGSLTTTESFVVTVTAVNDAPVVSALANRTILEDSGANAVSFTANDVDSVLSLGSVAVSTDSPGLVTISGISFTEPNGSFTVTPTANLSGTATITVSASDGTLTNSKTFTVTVQAVNDDPTVTTSGTLVVADIEQAVVRVRLFVTGSNTISLGTTTGITFVDVGTAGSLAPDGVVDGNGVADTLMGIQGTKAAVNAALDDLVTSGGDLQVRVDDITGATSVSDYAGTSGIAVTTRTNQFGPN